MRLDAVDEVVGALARHRSLEVLDDGRVGVHGREGLAVGVAPAAQEQPLGSDHDAEAASS
jgi:hypothetical protein